MTKPVHSSRAYAVATSDSIPIVKLGAQSFRYENLTYNKFGEGGNNFAFKSEDNRFVIKIPKKPSESQRPDSIENPIRSVRKFRRMYPHDRSTYETVQVLAEELLSGNGNGRARLIRTPIHALKMQFVEGTQAKDDAIALETLKHYLAVGEIIVDASIGGNYITTPAGRTVCVDTEFSLDLGLENPNPTLRRTASIASLKAWKENKSHYDHTILCQDLGSRRLIKNLLLLQKHRFPPKKLNEFHLSHEELAKRLSKRAYVKPQNLFACLAGEEEPSPFKTANPYVAEINTSILQALTLVLAQKNGSSDKVKRKFAREMQSFLNKGNELSIQQLAQLIQECERVFSHKRFKLCGRSARNTADTYNNVKLHLNAARDNLKNSGQAVNIKTTGEVLTMKPQKGKTLPFHTYAFWKKQVSQNTDLDVGSLLCAS